MVFSRQDHNRFSYSANVDHRWEHDRFLRLAAEEILAHPEGCEVRLTPWNALRLIDLAGALGRRLALDPLPDEETDGGTIARVRAWPLGG